MAFGVVSTMLALAPQMHKLLLPCPKRELIADGHMDFEKGDSSG